MNNRKVGDIWEAEAVRYLETQGYEIITKNYRCKLGEIDIIAKENNELVFIEVKYRSGNTYGNALEAVTVTKQNKIRKVALYYLATVIHSQYVPCRFDVIGFNVINGSTETTLIKNAF